MSHPPRSSTSHKHPGRRALTIAGRLICALAACAAVGCASPDEKAAGAADTGGPIERTVRADYVNAGQALHFSEERRADCVKADAGDPAALREVAEGVEQITLNGWLSEQLFLLGLSRGDARAAVEIGDLYWFGILGHKKDLRTAAWYYEAGAYVPQVPDDPDRKRAALEAAYHAAALYLLEMDPPDEERFFAVLNRALAIDPRDRLAQTTLQTLRPQEFPRTRDVSNYQIENASWQSWLASKLRDYRQSAQIRKEMEDDSRQFRAEDAARREASQQQMAQTFMSGLSGIGAAVTQGQQQLQASKDLNAQVRATGRLPGAYGAAGGPGGSGGNAAAPGYAGVTPGAGGAPPVTPARLPLGQRDAYLEAVRKCKEAAARATNSAVRDDWLRCADENQKMADQLPSNIPAIRVGG